MKANDLRVGNWINEFGIPKQVMPLDILGLHQIEHANETCIDLIPISLTEEWLLKFGFEKYSTICYHSQKWTLKNPILEKIKRTSEHFYILKRKGKYQARTRVQSDGIYLKTIQYVHQLQNLYFALTGEELTLNK